MDPPDETVETIVLSSEPVPPRLTAAEAECVARIRARRRRLRPRGGPRESRFRRWLLALIRR